MLFSIAYRNIWRAKGKTRITISLIALSTLMLVTFVSLITGTLNQIYSDAVTIYPGSIHINHKKFDQEPSYEHYIEDIRPILKTLHAHPDIMKQIASYSSRVESFFLASSKEHSVGSMLVGVEPEKETQNAKLHQTIIKGRYLKPTDSNAVVIGTVLAKKLHVDINSSVSIIGSATDYSFTADTLKVVGIFQTGINGYDASFMEINRKHLDTLILSEHMASHLVITPKNPDNSLHLAKEIDALLQDKTIESIDWHTHMAALIEGLELMRLSRYMLIYFFIAIIFAVIMIFAILIIFARKREVGIMRALGTTPRQIISIMFIERAILTLIGMVIGAIMAGFLTYYLDIHPITFDSLQDMVHRIGVMEFILKAKFSFEIIFFNAFIIFVLSMITVIYPILRIAYYKPIEAIHAV